jgi:phospholipid/cholesterol/gamma-HCH transport system substrate-binding protein
MRLLSTEAKVGIVVFAALLSLTWLTFQIGEFRFRQKGYLVEAVFRTVSGLEPKAKVRMAGVLVGSVDRIFLRDGLAHAELRINDGVEVRADSVVSVASIGILSERFVDITAGSRGAAVLPPGSVVSGRELIDLDQLMGQMADTAKSITALASSIKDTFGGSESTVAQLMRNTSSLVDRLNAMLDENRRRIADLVAQTDGLARDSRALLNENRAELHGTIANLREFSATLNRRADELTAELTGTAEDLRKTVREGGEDVRTLMASLRTAAGKAEQAADTLGSILHKVDAGTGTLGKLVNEDSSLAKVDSAVDQFGGIAQKINSGQGSLGRLVTDDTLVKKLETTVDSANRMLGDSDRLHLYLGYRGEYLAASENLKNYVTVKFQPRSDKYYLLELVDDPAGKRTITHTTTTVERPEGGYELQENTVVNEEGKLKFSLEFAKDFGSMTFRGGLIESQGGAGLDYRALGDRLRLSFDGWDFGRDEGPHYKLAGRLRLYKDVFVNAGVDDLAQEDFRSVFVGAGILFSDEDLKYLLSLARFSQ